MKNQKNEKETPKLKLDKSKLVELTTEQIDVVGGGTGGYPIGHIGASDICNPPKTK